MQAVLSGDQAQASKHQETLLGEDGLCILLSEALNLNMLKDLESILLFLVITSGYCHYSLF